MLLGDIMNKLREIETRLKTLETKSSRAEVAGGVSRKTTAELGDLTGITGQIYMETDRARPSGTNGIIVFYDSANFIDLATNESGVFPVSSYTVAALTAITPSAPAIAFASNGRKTGEGAGAGTGVLCYYDNTAWRRVDDGTTVVS